MFSVNWDTQPPSLPHGAPSQIHGWASPISRASQFIRQSLQIKSSHVSRHSLKRLHNLLHALPALLVCLKVTVGVYISTICVPFRQVPEEDVHGDADAFRWNGRSVQPQGRDKEDITRVESCRVRVRVWYWSWSRRVVWEDVQSRAGCPWWEVKLGDIGWGIDD